MKSMRYLLLPVLIGLATPMLHAENRLFTTSDGKFMEGELVSATTSQATLKTTDGKQTTVETGKLIRMDREYVEGWLKSHAPVVHYKFDVAWSKDKTGSKTEGHNHTKVTRNTYVTHFKVTNISGQPVENVELHYQVYYMDIHGTESTMRHKDGVIKLAPMNAGANVAVDAAPFDLESTQLTGGYTYTSGAPSRQIDSFRGVAATFMHDGQSVFEYLTPGITKAPDTAAKKTEKSTKPK